MGYEIDWNEIGFIYHYFVVYHLKLKYSINNTYYSVLFYYFSLFQTQLYWNQSSKHSQRNPSIFLGEEGIRLVATILIVYNREGIRLQFLQGYYPRKVVHNELLYGLRYLVHRSNGAVSTQLGSILLLISIPVLNSDYMESLK